MKSCCLCQCVILTNDVFITNFFLLFDICRRSLERPWITRCRHYKYLLILADGVSITTDLCIKIIHFEWENIHLSNNWFKYNRGKVTFVEMIRYLMDSFSGKVLKSFRSKMISLLKIPLVQSDTMNGRFHSSCLGLNITDSNEAYSLFWYSSFKGKL